MAFRLGPLLIGGGVIVAAGLMALFYKERTPEPAPVAPADRPQPAMAASPAPEPHAAQAPAPQEPTPSEGSGGSDAPIVWKVPSGWHAVPNPNGMRLATYDVPDPAPGEHAEVSVSRAGGSIDANIQRWRGQFLNADQARRAEKTVRGLAVTLVEISGDYSASMVPGAPASVRPDYALVAAIVQTSGTSYFFKMVGPSARVRSARASFDTLVDSFGPR